MSINKNYLDKFIKSTEMAAIGAYDFIGKGDKIAADQGAVNFMRNELNKIQMKAKVVIGEGEMDEAPMLFIGEKLGTGHGQELDIAVDPLEGTNFVAKNLPNSFAVLAVSEKGNLLSAPDTYMEKIAIGSGFPSNLLDLDNSVEENINLLAKAKETPPNNLTVCVLDRPRHHKIVQSLKKLKVKIKYIQDGDVSGVISVIDKTSPIDIYMGIGGGPEGVLAGAALSCLGGQMQTRLVLDNNQITRAAKLGVKDYKKKYNLDDMVKGDVIFCATAITDGEIVKGVIKNKNSFETSTFALHKSSQTYLKITNIHTK
jgi:fructose-1,6-bisphosphatase II / sedoheptulose-1,7-bisphosphatase